MIIKIVSLNLWNGGRLLNEALAFLHHEQPDLILLQEVYAGDQSWFESRFRTVEVITQVFPEFDYHFAPAYQDQRQVEGPIDEGQLILSRWPILGGGIVFFDIPYGPYDQDATTDFSQWPAGAQQVQIQIGSQLVRVINVHGPVNLQGDQDCLRRQKMGQVLQQMIADQPAVILAGDFNAQPQVKSIQNIERVLTNVFPDELTTSFNMRRKTNPGYATAVVDTVFVSPSWKITSHYQPQVDISDHFPLVVQIDLPD